MFKAYLYTALFVSVSLYVVSTFGNVSFAQMTGTLYKIQSDSVNFGGGLSTSTSYTQESTAGEVATGESSGTLYKIKAGYQQMQEVYIAITSVSDVVMSPNIGGVTGGTSNGSAVVTVITDSPSGYELSIKASSSPALVSGANSFADYTPAGANPDFTFSIAASASEFAFTPEGSHIVQKFKDNGSNTCNVDTTDTADACWYNLSTANEVISRSTSPNHPSGTATTLKFRAQSGTAHLQPEGVYLATTTVTALPL